MKKFTCTKVFRFCCAHYLKETVTEKCKSTHGHSYKLEITLGCNYLSDNNMVIDFTILKEMIKPVIDFFDHQLIAPGIELKITVGEYGKFIRFIEQPTAEVMADIIFDFVEFQLDNPIYTEQHLVTRKRVWIEKVKLWEEMDSSCVEVIRNL